MRSYHLTSQMMSGGRFRTILSSCRGMIPLCRKLLTWVSHIDDVQTEVPPALSGESYVVKDGLLYHQPRAAGGTQKTQGTGASDGHKIPWAGHLSKTKSHERIAARFYWPGFYGDVLNYCKSCPECQLTSSRKTSPYPLQPLPVIEVPFIRIVMDIVGPLERTQTGYKYILVICDYASCYPEAFLLRTGFVAAILQDGHPTGSPH